MRQTHCQTETQCCVSQSNSCSSLPHIKLQQLSLMLFSVMLGRKRSPKPTTVYHSFTQDVPGVFQVFFCSWETMLLPTSVCPLQQGKVWILGDFGRSYCSTGSCTLSALAKVFLYSVLSATGAIFTENRWLFFCMGKGEEIWARVGVRLCLGLHIVLSSRTVA